MPKHQADFPRSWPNRVFVSVSAMIDRGQFWFSGLRPVTSGRYGSSYGSSGGVCHWPPWNISRPPECRPRSHVHPEPNLAMTAKGMQDKYCIVPCLPVDGVSEGYPSAHCPVVFRHIG